MTDNASSNPLDKVIGEFAQQAVDEPARNERLLELTTAVLPHLGVHWNAHSILMLKRQSMSKILYYNELYQQIVNVPGVILEFGAQWGAGVTTLINLRGMYEPFNHSRTIVGFDTFEGYTDIDAQDGGLVSTGDYATTQGYEATLDEILSLQESFSPIPHKKKFELVKGDVSVTAGEWLDRNPQAVVAMAIFDLNVYRPTRDALEAVLPRLTKGSVLAFNELNCPHLPGETAAVQEVLGVNNLKLRQWPHMPYRAWAVYGE